MLSKFMMSRCLASLLAIGICASCTPFDDAGTPDRDEGFDDGPELVDPAVPADDDLCAGDGDFDLEVSSDYLPSDLVGERVWVVAVHFPATADEDAPLNFLAARVSGEVDVHGGFSLSCNDSLAENNSYPSVAVLIDRDGSGGCSPEDLMVEEQHYGWHQDVRLRINSNWLQPVGDTRVRSGVPFCDFYFD